MEGKLSTLRQPKVRSFASSAAEDRVGVELRRVIARDNLNTQLLRGDSNLPQTSAGRSFSQLRATPLALDPHAGVSTTITAMRTRLVHFIARKSERTRYRRRDFTLE